MIPSELMVRYRGSADEVYAWYRDEFPGILKTTGLPVTATSADDASRTVTCEFGSFGGNAATYRYTVSPGEPHEGADTVTVRLATSVHKSPLLGRGFESKMLGLFMITDQLVGQRFPVVPG
ncbi:MAG: hypothetical protein ABI725_03010 [Chloroflexota bacterium]